MPIVIQKKGNELFSLPYKPKRIVSLVPSQTELLFDLGLTDEVVGITKFCIHPTAWFRNKERVGGTKNIHFDKVMALKPDLILANKEENVKEQLEALQVVAPVWVSDVNDLDSALLMIKAIGEMTGKCKEAFVIAKKIIADFKTIVPLSPAKTTGYLIWCKPYMAAGGDTFINDLMFRCGFTNALKNVNRYPVIEIKNDALVVSKEQKAVFNNIKLLLLSSEPFPFKQQHIDELQQLLPNTKIMLVDGEMFSWYGSRLLQAPKYLKQLINESV